MNASAFSRFGLMFIALTAIFLTSCADLRTKVSKKNPQPDRAKQLMLDMGKAHGIENWKSISTYTVEFEDEFFGKIGKSAKPYPDMKTTFDLTYIPQSFDGRLQIRSGAWENTVWGIQSWKTYEMDENGKAVFTKHKDAYFWVPTYQYFIEFPLRIQEATALAYAGEEEIDGIQCEGVIASWNSVKPNRKIDQYLIWIEKESKRIYKLEYTIREINTLIKGAAYFKDFKDYNGIVLPSRLPVESNLVKGGLLHEMRVNNFKANTVEISDLRPNKELNKNGDQKPD